MWSLKVKGRWATGGGWALSYGQAHMPEASVVHNWPGGGRSCSTSATLRSTPLLFRSFNTNNRTRQQICIEIKVKRDYINIQWNLRVKQRNEMSKEIGTLQWFKSVFSSVLHWNSDRVLYWAIGQRVQHRCGCWRFLVAKLESTSHRRLAPVSGASADSSRLSGISRQF